jgi:hypothetical protein
MGGALMLAILTMIAMVIGFAVLAAIGVLLVLMAVGYVHDLIRTWNLRYDLYLYDDVARWNRRWRRRAERQKANRRDPTPAPDDAKDGLP